MTTLETMTTPSGTTGLAVEPWGTGEIYAVAANWAQASAPVYSYGNGGWDVTGQQVADYRHRATAALRAVIVQSLAESEGIPSSEVIQDDVDDIMDGAVKIG